MYTLRLIRRIGLSEEAGGVRASLVHYNTLADVEMGDALVELAGAVQQ